MVRFEVFDPTGLMQVTNSHAPRLDSLRDKKLGFVSIDEWQAYRTFPLLRDHLRNDAADTELLPLDAFPRGIGPISTESTAQLVAESGVDAVIVGNAA